MRSVDHAPICLRQKFQFFYVKNYIWCSARLVLDPVSFILYINEMLRSSNQMFCVHFADNTTVFTSDSDIINVHVTVNGELVVVHNWLKTNRLSLNVSKTLQMKLSTQIPLIFYNISETNYPLTNHLICTTQDTKQIKILILHYLIIQKHKNIFCSKYFPYGTAHQIRLKIALLSLHSKSKLKATSQHPNLSNV